MSRVDQARPRMPCAAFAVATLAAPLWLAVCAAGAAEPPLTLVVMDPLAAPLSCPCVKGYAQRDYQALGTHLATTLDRPVEVVFGESLATAVGKAGPGGKRADIVVGKRSVVSGDAARSGHPLGAIADLTDLTGSTRQRGLVVVRSDDTATTVADLAAHRILLGPADCDEKHDAARALLAAAGIAVPADAPVAEACSDGAEAVIAARDGRAVATVISSYARPLLEGCGTIKRGDLRVIGETADVPFISAFVATDLSEPLRAAITAAILTVAEDPLLLLALESKQGFVALEAAAADTPAAAPPARGAAAPLRNPDWPGWRGRERDARVPWLPERFPATKRVRWKQVLFNEGLGGVAVAGDRVVVGDRDAADTTDVFHGLDRTTGKRIWTLEYPAPGRLDYGNSPRATPLIVGERAYLLGAFGHLHCVRVADGTIEWQRHLRDDFRATDELVWGVCSSPLIVDGHLIVNPGGRDAALVGLDPATGAERWRVPGAPAAFASLIAAGIGGRRQVIGFDKTSCGGWDPTTGERLWSLAPRVAGDFNVPTPVLCGERVAVVAENNGARLIAFDGSGAPAVVAAFAALVPDMHTPVATAGRLFAVHRGKAYCLAADDLAMQWTVADRSLKGHASLVASPERVLVFTAAGELILLDARADSLAILDRQKVFERDVSLYAHPAVADDAIYVRGPRGLVCVELAVPPGDGSGADSGAGALPTPDAAG